MKDITNSENMENIYTRKWLKIKLKEKYTDSVIFAEVQGKADVLCFRDAAEYLINDKWYESRRNDAEEEAERVIKQAAQIILRQIRSTKFNVKLD
jgi:hypothetical protein